MLTRETTPRRDTVKGPVRTLSSVDTALVTLVPVICARCEKQRARLLAERQNSRGKFLKYRIFYRPIASGQVTAAANGVRGLLLLLLMLISLIGRHYVRIWRSFVFYGLLSRGRTQV